MCVCGNGCVVMCMCKLTLANYYPSPWFVFSSQVCATQCPFPPGVCV